MPGVAALPDLRALVGTSEGGAALTVRLRPSVGEVKVSKNKNAR